METAATTVESAIAPDAGEHLLRLCALACPEQKYNQSSTLVYKKNESL